MTMTRDDAQVLFHVVGMADTNLLPRLLEHFCLRDVLPERVSAERHGDEMRVTIAVRRDDCPEWEMVARKLGQIFVVRSALASLAEPALQSAAG
ncbi:hypothetical protein [Inquilinus limosus]|uniref:ACT domain-containing protein n=1 Tax=Inquilinus limosus MP06 TaxID=1398085 RepID=A0A0A0D9D9_9PROT|nr:hypothetical protein [Inquilinus limosus]KGM34458.1 hypothetical protein P409_10105 [Inquilinus limosus MP06]